MGNDRADDGVYIESLPYEFDLPFIAKNGMQGYLEKDKFVTVNNSHASKKINYSFTGGIETFGTNYNSVKSGFLFSKNINQSIVLNIGVL